MSIKLLIEFKASGCFFSSAYKEIHRDVAIKRINFNPGTWKFGGIKMSQHVCATRGQHSASLMNFRASSPSHPQQEAHHFLRKCVLCEKKKKQVEKKKK